MAPDVMIRLDGAKQFLVPLDLQIRVEPTLHQNSSASQVDGLLDFLQDDFLRKDVTLLMAHGPIESTEAAIFSAEICVVDVPVDDVADNSVRMKLSPDCVCLHADAYKII